MSNIILTDEQDHLIEELTKWFHDYENGRRIRNHSQWYSYSGPAGSGKTFVIIELINKLNLSEDEYITCAYTGRAALNLQQKDIRSCTIHSLIYHTILEKVESTNDEI